MFVLQSTYDRAQRKIKMLEDELSYEKSRVLRYQRQSNRAIHEHNELVDMINKRGGQRFLDGEVGSGQFTEKEISTLIMLCHPDKHNGKESATLITTKLLKMRKS